MSNNKEPWVSASEVGSIDYCSKAFEYKEAGVKPSYIAKKNMKSGTKSHVKLNQAIKYKAYVKKQGQQRDSRCFVASQVYGFDHPNTNALREWRDTYLMTNFVGRILVSIYYKLSPILVHLCRKLPIIDSVSRKAVDAFMRIFRVGR